MIRMFINISYIVIGIVMFNSCIPISEKEVAKEERGGAFHFPFYCASYILYDCINIHIHQKPEKMK